MILNILINVIFKSHYFQHDNCDICQPEEDNQQDQDYFCEEVSVGDGPHELTDEIQFYFHPIDFLNEVLSVLDLFLQYCIGIFDGLACGLEFSVYDFFVLVKLLEQGVVIVIIVFIRRKGCFFSQQFLFVAEDDGFKSPTQLCFLLLIVVDFGSDIALVKPFVANEILADLLEALIQFLELTLQHFEFIAFRFSRDNIDLSLDKISNLLKFNFLSNFSHPQMIRIKIKYEL